MTTEGNTTARDFVRPTEGSDYAAITEAWRKELAATGPVEETLAIEIASAAWRLRRCGLIESGFNTLVDPMLDPATAPLQTVIDRARSSAHSRFLRSIAELRRLQTERHFRDGILEGDADPTLGLTSCQSLAKSFALDARRKMQQRRLDQLATIEDVIDATLPPVKKEDWLCSAEKPEAAATAPITAGNAPPVLQKAA